MDRGGQGLKLALEIVIITTLLLTAAGVAGGLISDVIVARHPHMVVPTGVFTGAVMIPIGGVAGVVLAVLARSRPDARRWGRRHAMTLALVAAVIVVLAASV